MQRCAISAMRPNDRVGAHRKQSLDRFFADAFSGTRIAKNNCGAVDEVTQPDDLVIGKVPDAGRGVDASGRNRLLRERRTDPEDICEADLDALVAW